MKKTVFLMTVILLTACQQNKHSRPDFQAFIQAEELTQMDRVQQFRFWGWQPLDDRYLILSSSQRRSYLIKLMSSCNDLTFANHIKLKQDFSSTLNAKFDSIEVPGQFQQECTIHSIYPMDKEQKLALLEFADQKEEIRE